MKLKAIISSLAVLTAIPAFSQAVDHFDRIATLKVNGAVAEIVAATPDGRTLVYTNGTDKKVGFVDIATPSAPREIGATDVPGEPTSVAVTNDGMYALAVVDGTPSTIQVIAVATRVVERVIPLEGQPDSIAISPNGRYGAIAMENERNETLNGGAIPQLPGGTLVILDINGSLAQWTTRTVELAGIANRFASDPEPEFVDINSNNIAAITLQENNHVVLVDLVAGRVTGHWNAGTTTHAADVTRDSDFRLDGMITAARREPDAIAWTPGGRLVTANEGDYSVGLAAGEYIGGRNYTIFAADGTVVFDAGSEVEVEAIRHGHYPDARSNSKGVEVEGVEIAVFGNRPFLFVGSERGHFVAVYSLENELRPTFVQLLPTGLAPEGLLAIPSRSLFVTANETDGSLSIFEGRPQSSSPVYPHVVSTGTIAWSALSGLSTGPGRTIYAVPDSAMRPSRIFTMEVGKRLTIASSLTLPKNFDLEGITTAESGWWVVSEGAGAAGAATATKNLLVRVNANGTIAEEIELPAELNAKQVQFGFEGVALSGDGRDVYVAIQREWADDPVGFTKIGVYNIAAKSWKFFHYPLDPAPAITGAWVGLSEITRIDANRFAIIERDNQKAPLSRIKRIYEVSIAGVTPVAFGGNYPKLTKTLLRDLIAQDKFAVEKVEGLTFTPFGMVVVSDNDGVGETVIIRNNRARSIWK